MDVAKTVKRRFRVGDLDLPERKMRSTSSREEEEVDCTDVPVCRAIESRTHMVGECDVYKEELGALEEVREIDECDMDEFDTLDSSEKTIVILGDGGHRRRNRKGMRLAKKIYLVCDIWKRRHERQNVGGVSNRSRNGAPSRKGFVVSGQMTKASNK